MKTLSEQIKEVLVQLALDDKLPIDITNLDASVFDGVGEQTNFPNDFSSWMETHHEIVGYITLKLHYYKHSADESEIIKREEEQGRGGIYELAEDWTNEFEELNKDRLWDGEFFDEIDAFCDRKNFN